MSAFVVVATRLRHCQCVVAPATIVSALPTLEAIDRPGPFRSVDD